MSAAETFTWGTEATAWSEKPLDWSGLSTPDMIRYARDAAAGQSDLLICVRRVHEQMKRMKREPMIIPLNPELYDALVNGEDEELIEIPKVQP